MSCPDQLYKYQSLSAHSLAGLVNETVWLSKPTSFNDPFDCAITLDRQKHKESVLHAVSVALERSDTQGLNVEKLRTLWPGDEEAFEKYREQMLGLVQNMGVCSFSAVGDHLLMWSHYANHHRGFCVEYDSREGTKLRTLAHPVRYQDEAPSLAASDFAPEKNGNALDIMGLTKATCWAYEQEWRVMMTEGNKPFQAPSEVISVVFGARMPETERIMIAHALRHRPAVAFKEARLVEGKFLLEIVEV
jgi:DUF2971 family protein